MALSPDDIRRIVDGAGGAGFDYTRSGYYSTYMTVRDEPVVSDREFSQGDDFYGRDDADKLLHGHLCGYIIDAGGTNASALLSIAGLDPVTLPLSPSYAEFPVPVFLNTGDHWKWTITVPGLVPDRQCGVSIAAHIRSFWAASRSLEEVRQLVDACQPQDVRDFKVWHDGRWMNYGEADNLTRALKRDVRSGDPEC